MRAWVIFSGFLLMACGDEPKEINTVTKTTKSISEMQAQPNSADTTTGFIKDTTSHASFSTPQIKKPSGIYRFLLPDNGNQKVLQTIAFYPSTYRLQEEYPGKKDSVVVTEGTWAPSEGFIWLYKEQVMRGRYTWKGDTLQYYNPRLKKSFSMTKLTPASANAVWQTKRQEGAILYGVGNEPFWSVELTNTDSLVLNMPDWNAPLRVKLATASKAKDSTIYTATSDSLQVTVYPLFCNDGMSDFLYTKKIKVSYKGKIYKGCGEIFRPAN